MARPPRSCTRFDEYGTSRMVGTALQRSTQSYSDRADGKAARSAVGEGQRGWTRMIEREDLRFGTCLWRARSGFPPSSRAGLFVIGQYSFLQHFKAEKTLTTTGGRSHSGFFRCHRACKGTVPTREVGVVRLGLLTNRRPIMARVRRLIMVVCLGRV